MPDTDDAARKQLEIAGIRQLQDALTAKDAEIERVKNRAIAYPCACCGAPAYAAVDSIDTGTTLTCETCGGKSIVSVETGEWYSKMVNACAKIERLLAAGGELDRLVKYLQGQLMIHKGMIVTSAETLVQGRKDWRDAVAGKEQDDDAEGEQDQRA